MQVVRIVGDVVELQEVSEVKRARLPEFLAHLSEQAGIRTPILAPGTIHYAAQGRTSVFTFEIPPGRRTLRFRSRDGRTKEYMIPLPWIYLMAGFCERALDRVYVYLTTEPLRSTEAQLFHLPVPNRYPDGLVCLGNFRFDITLSDPHKVDGVVRFYFESLFTNEILDSFNSFVPEQIATRTQDGTMWFDGWSRLSDEELKTVVWKPYKPFSEAVQAILDRR